MISSRRWLAPWFASVLMLAGCSSSSEEDALPPLPPGELVASSKERVQDPNVPAEDFAALVSGNTDFGVSLYQQIAKPGDNLFFSPFSVTQAFALLYPGARGTTETQMAQALHFSLPQDRLHPALNALDQKLRAQVATSPGEPGKAPSFRLVNAAWGQQGLQFEPAFLDVLAVNYGTGLRTVDFVNESASIRKGINDWVADQTANRIQNLLSEKAVTPNTRLLLANALYFKGSWSSPFNKDFTRSGDFHALEGGTQSVQMMRGEGNFGFLQGEGFDAISLPYVGNAFRMLVIVPEETRFAEIESRLSAQFLDGVRAGLQQRYFNLGFPRFEVKKEFPLEEAMQALGMVEAFTDKANLSGLTSQAALMITAAQHQAFVAVNEEGTEAAAATAISTGPASIPDSYTVDRPFIVLIENTETKSVLFLGRILKP
ncbi:serpin family protein [Hyalangium versicolor]|uniref:serpin family protein n=1 Tax=Hyalangium versicolor TaxID=2861190 RepID=UPI001CCE6C09|nr:serpin family protein [Hyalangium versicolor]